MFRSLKKYDFNNNSRLSHYIKTDEELNEAEQKMLGEILLSFPHVENHQWPEAFAAFNPDNIPQKLLTLAANAYDRNGNTVLGVAAENGKHIAALQRLINMGANLDTLDDNNKLALHWAICNKSNSNKASKKDLGVLKCLLDNGARTDIPYYYKMTPFEYAKEHKYTAAASMLDEESVAKIYSCGSTSLFWQCAKKLSQNISPEQVEKLPSDLQEAVRRAKPFRYL